MTIIEIQALENGAHRNQSGQLKVIPEGWAVIPEEIDGVMTVTSWEAVDIPEDEPPVEVEPPITADEILNVLLGVTE